MPRLQNDAHILFMPCLGLPSPYTAQPIQGMNRGMV